jgi:hypothetical protein
MSDAVVGEKLRLPRLMKEESRGGFIAVDMEN